jgi:hypothetical protein
VSEISEVNVFPGSIEGWQWSYAPSWTDVVKDFFVLFGNGVAVCPIFVIEG